LFLAYSIDGAPPDFTEDMIRKEFAHAGLTLDGLVEIKDSPNQPTTAIRALQALEWEGPFMIKDSDNYWEAQLESMGVFVVTADLQMQGPVVPGNKSYVSVDRKGVVKKIAEKEVLGRNFCVGGYGFPSYHDLSYACEAATEKLNGAREVHVSDCVAECVERGYMVEQVVCNTYLDWGTAEAWQRFRGEFRTLFVDIDGVLFKNAARSFSPRWGEAPPITANIEHLKALVQSGQTEIILCTSRSEEAREATVAQLASVGLVYKQLIMGLQHARRYLINDYSKTNPFPASVAVNLPRDSEQLSGLF
jgi:hypothetical protein